MKILVVGSGGREHAIAWRLSNDPVKHEIFCAPGNAGTASVAQNVPVGAEDIDGIVSWARLNNPELVVVGPEAPLVKGLVDELTKIGIPSFGPVAAGARMEGSKRFAKEIMDAAGVPTGKAETFTDASAAKALIDHHPQPDTIFNIVYSYPQMSSTCELAYWVVKDLVEILGGNMPMHSAIALYTGMMTDTNNFNNSVLPSTFRMAGELMEAGVDKEWVQKMVFGGYSADRMRLMGYMLHENMKLIPEYNAAVMVLTKAIKEKYNFSDGDSEGFVNLALNIRSVRVSALFTEDNGFLRVSLRSMDDFSVNRLSRAYFNGGGHERAAGGRLYIPVGEVEDYYIKSLGEFIESEKKAQLL